MGKVDTLLDVALEALDSLGQEALLLLGDALQGVDGLLGTVGLYLLSVTDKKGGGEQRTYAELDGDGEEVTASLLGDGLAARNTGQVDVAGLDEALLASGGLEDLLGEAVLR